MNGSETLPADEIAPAGGLFLPVARRAFGFAAGVVRKSPAFVGALAFFVAMMTAFIILSPEVFLRPEAYTAIFASLPLLIIMAVPSTFVITAGEIDLSFPSVVGVTALVFATAAAGGVNPFAALVLALLSGLGAGVVNGVLVTMIGLPSLVATLGMYFLLRGVVNMVTQGLPTELPSLQGSLFRRLFVGEIGTVPVQMFWGMGFAFVGILLFTKHRFGAHVRAAGDNELTTREMGVNVNLVRTRAFMYVGLAAGLVGVLEVLINNTFWPTVGDDLLLLVLTSVFVGGTPTRGGVGSVAGAVVGAFSVSFLEEGLIAAGLSGFYTQFFYGLLIVLSLTAHSLRRKR